MTTAPALYSQFGEDVVILANTPEHGRFLDIGAWNPKVFSNTRALYERGWSGVMIEPSPGPFGSLLDEYGNDERITLILAAVGFERCCAKLWVTDDAVSTTVEGNYDAWKHAAKFRGAFFTPVMTLADIFNQFGGGFDFVNIDTEGTSVDLLHELLKTSAFPKCICVEHDGREGEVLQATGKYGYYSPPGGTNGTNIVLVR